MPRISKVRIVNFKYNDGHRLIADELFDFETADRSDTQNVLINLANGGGKSVLVQLMMQPMLPKAKVAGRKIESFFNRTSDHCFILLEWLKDNSHEKLLTGIAMAAREQSGGEDEERGMSVKYYTFSAGYAGDEAKYSLLNLPLSRRENSRFIPADFDAVRQLAKKSGGVLKYYSSDDQLHWRKEMEQYGLIQEEWRMIEDLNSEEGGLGKYFGKFKTSDSLVDKLLIPCIERKLSHSEVKGDHSLSTMLLSHAEQYAKHELILREREVYQRFAGSLEELKPLAEELWTANDRVNQSIGRLFGLSDALGMRLKELQQEQERAAVQLDELGQQRTHIQWEQASAQYYSCQEALELAVTQHERTVQAAEQKEAELNNTVHDRKAMECADYAEKLREITCEIETIREEIKRREQGIGADSRLADLKYSAFCEIKTVLEQCTAELDSLRQEREALEVQLREQERQLSDAEKEHTDRQRDLNMAEGKLASIREETDRAVKHLDENLLRKLDCFYAQEEVERVIQQLKDRQSVLLCEQEKNLTARTALEEEERKLPEQKVKLRYQLEDTQRKAEEEISALESFHAEEQKICTLFEQYNLDPGLRFTDRLTDFLRGELDKNEAEFAEVLRKSVVAEEALSAAERGSVHVVQAVIDYLNASGVTYTTCEKYLLDLVDQGSLTKERCLDILRHYPAAAYGILIDKKNTEKLFAFEREQWLPSMVPLFNSDQMKKILDVEKQFSGAIAFYDEGYFADKENHILNLRRKRDQLEERKKHILIRKAELNDQMECARSFHRYSDTWEREQKKLLAQLENTGKKCRDQLDALEKLEQSLSERREKLKSAEAELSHELNQLDKRLEWGTEALRRMAEEGTQGEKAYHNREAANAAQRALEAVREKREETSAELKAQEETIQGAQTLLEKLQGGLGEVDGCSPAQRLEGDWRDLLEQYRQLQSTADTEMNLLREKLKHGTMVQNLCEKELQSRQIPAADYEALTYSEAEKERLVRLESYLSEEKRQADRAEKAAFGERRISETEFSNAEKMVHVFGEALPRADVGGDFEGRLTRLKLEEAQIEERRCACNLNERKVEKVYNKLSSVLAGEERPVRISAVILSDAYDKQYAEAQSALTDSRKLRDAQHQDMGEKLFMLGQNFQGTTEGISEAVAGMQAQLNGRGGGDRYFTLSTQIDGNLQNVRRMISKIETDLKDFEHQRSDLIHHCILQGQRIYEGLIQMQNSSKVTVHEDKPKKEMLRFQIPKEVDAVKAEASIREELDHSVREIAASLGNESMTDAARKKLLADAVGSSILLRKYIGQDTIQVMAYKIDRSAQNSQYRTWEKTQVNNSGAEKFVVYFAVILSLINFTRGAFHGIQDKELHSALILDNPFGATSSKHILEPMFAIAKHFRVQMLCLSDINKTDVLNCFDMVIKAIIKKVPLSNTELLTHEENEQIEHGFYRAEQMSLL